jgi:flagellar biosynthetic protein FliQ
MHADLALHMMSDLLWTAFLVSVPVLAITLLVGLAVSVMQVVTQVQEMSLTFIPKIVAAGITLTLLGGWMLRKIMQYAVELWANIPAMF